MDDDNRPSNVDRQVVQPSNQSQQDMSGPAAGATPPSGPNKKRTIPFGLVVLLAVVISAALVLIGYLAYQGNEPVEQNVVETAHDEHDDDNAADTTSEVDESTIDKEIEQIESEIESLDNTSDFNQNDLSEESIGL